MIRALGYVRAVFRNRMQRLKGELLRWYLWLHGCKVGKGLKCASFPYIKGIIHKNITIGNYVDLGRNNTIEISEKGQLIMEDYVLLHQNILISCNNRITFRKFAGVAENVSIRDGNHRFAKEPYFRLQEGTSEPIELGEDSGVAAGCVIQMGAKISKGAFIGSNAVVTRRDVIEEYGIYAGNPLKFIRKRV